MKQVGSLGDYQAKRDFARTPEPRGRKAARRADLSFFIQKHHASHLHYDFRLELDGVLKSWAVPKGPSLDPALNRLAVHVEDHPLDYGSFEGTIPKGQYGAGTVLLWDRGLWRPEGDAVEAYRRGKLTFALEGRKLGGRWSLVRFEGSDDAKGKEHWLLRKLKDASSRATEDILVTRPESVLAEAAPAPKNVPGAVAVPFPQSIDPQLATLVATPPLGDEWIHEIKFDGYRYITYLEQRKARLVTRNGIDWTARLPLLAGELAMLPARDAVLDGEVVALAQDGTSDFEALKDALGKRRDQDLVYYVFDLLHLDGYDLRELPLLRRKELLQKLLEPGLRTPHVRYSDHVEGSGELFFRRSCEFALEGVVSKRKEAPYRSGRGLDWVKVKCQKRQEFVIGGFTDPQSSRKGLGALLLGVHEGDRLVYAGRVGTGFSAELLKELRRRLDRLERPTSPFASALSRLESRGAHWVEPRLVAEVSFSNWTRDRRLRHPSFLGLREDKPADDVVLERPAPVPQTEPKIRLTHPERILYPSEGLTKQDLADFYRDVAPWILPHVRGRLLSLVRCPEGQAKPCFYQKHRMEKLPPGLHVLPIRESEGPSTGLYIEDETGLLGLIQMGVLEIHPWGSRVETLEHPDRCTFDLDPGPGVSWSAVIETARELRGRLRALGLESFVKTTGGKGLHVVVPFTAAPGWAELKAFAKAIAEEFARRYPERYTAKLSKSSRGGKIFIDYLRNGRGATAVAAYSTRARPNAPVSVPLAWDELDPSLRSDQYTVRNLRRRLDRLTRDPWKDLFDLKQSLGGSAPPSGGSGRARP